MLRNCLKLRALVLSCVLMCSAYGYPGTTVIVGATLIDLDHFGTSQHDLQDAAVLIRDGRIIAVGPESEVAIPKDAERIDARGKFLVPGLIDGFGAVRNQAFAQAYLYEGVTTVYVPIILAGGGGDGEVTVVKNPAPGPRIFLGAPMTGYSMKGEDPSDKPMAEHRLHDQRLSNQQLIERLDKLAEEGYRGITISYDVWPDQMDVIIAEAKRRGLAIIAEPGFTSYPYAIRAGVEALLRNDHYLTELAPALAQLTRADELARGVAAYRALCATDPQSDLVTQYGQQLAGSQTALMPVLALEATADSLDIANPWSAPVAALISPKDLDVPVDRVTGASGFLASIPAERREFVLQCGWKKEALDSRLHSLEAKFLAGSAAASYGVMPGSGLHVELDLLQRIGLTPRQALAAATANYAEIYGWSDVGKIEPGRNADLLVLNQDPRQNLSALDAIDRIIFNGVSLDRPRLLATTDPR